MRCPRCDRELMADDRFCSRCGLARSTDGEPVDPLIGIVVVDRYKIIERIGVGGMGTVYRGEHVRWGQSVAIKVLHERYASDKKLIRRFEKEALSYGQVSHPNLVGLHDYGTMPDGVCFMVLDYCPGISLAKLMREQGRLSPSLSADIVLQIAQALAAAHHEGIIHRDLKPENVILMETSPGRYHARLLDFGIAKRTDDDEPRLTQAGMVFGTPEYMSPEQARGKPVDARSDLYALGTMLYELMVGEPPFSGPDKLQIMSQQANEPPEPPTRRVPQVNIPDGLEAIALQCLEKEPNHRFQDCTALIRALDQVMNRVERPGSLNLTKDVVSSVVVLEETVTATDDLVGPSAPLAATTPRMVRPRRNRPVLPPIFTPSRAWIALGVGLLVGLTIIHHVVGKSEQNSEVATAGRAVQDSFVKRIEREVRAEILASQARKELPQSPTAATEKQRRLEEEKRQAARRAKAERQAKQEALSIARKAMREGRFHTVHTVVGKFLDTQPKDRDAHQLKVRARRLKTALAKAQRAFKKADCIRTLDHLKPVMRAAPKFRSGRRMVNVCRRALPPKHL